jgi:predicted acylesterase/phospholipase RssA
MRKLLSIRGGGIRGIIPCCCLMRLESQLGGVTRDHIDFCAGTSTGALLTAAIAAGIPASELLKVYTERSHEIFTPTGAVAKAKRLVEGYMYDPAHLHDVLAGVFGDRADWTVNQSPIRVMISATAINGHNWFFVKDNARNKAITGRTKLLDAAVASACAPTYFDNWKIDNIDGKSIRFYDGGSGGTANPAYQACVEAFDYDDFTPATSLLVALGTGFFPATDTPPSGLFDTIGWATGTLVDTGADWVDQAVNRQWPGLMTSKNVQLPREIDEADLSAIGDLVKIGQQMAAGLDWTALLGGVTAEPKTPSLTL